MNLMPVLVGSAGGLLARLRRRWLACVEGLVALARSPVLQQL